MQIRRSKPSKGKEDSEGKRSFLQEALQYDQKRFYKEGQKDLKDVWSYRTSPIQLKDGRSNFGYIRIKKDASQTSTVDFEQP